jgi:phosphoribosyl 1,2-cyclic phosphate phosphodiesterase
MSVELLFLGSGTSAGVPMIGCHCEVCSSRDPKDHRSRPSVVISQGATTVLVDTSPELRLQCVANRIDMIDAVVITHGHADWAEPLAFETVSRCFGYAFQEPPADLKVFRPQLVHREISGEFSIGAMKWKPIRLFHGKLPVLGFRVGKLAYCTDVNLIPEESFELLEGLDLLVLDALQRTPHSTHFCVDEALAIVDRVKPKMARFTHIAHSLGHAATNATLPRHVQLAFDGERLSVGE